MSDVKQLFSFAAHFTTVLARFFSHVRAAPLRERKTSILLISVAAPLWFNLEWWSEPPPRKWEREAKKNIIINFAALVRMKNLWKWKLSLEFASCSCGRRWFDGFVGCSDWKTAPRKWTRRFAVACDFFPIFILPAHTRLLGLCSGDFLDREDVSYRSSSRRSKSGGQDTQLSRWRSEKWNKNIKARAPIKFFLSRRWSESEAKSENHDQRHPEHHRSSFSARTLALFFVFRRKWLTGMRKRDGAEISFKVNGKLCKKMEK